MVNVLGFSAAGSGKTVLAAAIVDHQFSVPQGTKSSISYFFCDFNDPRSREPKTILTSLARQILNIFDETPEISERLKSMFETNHREPKINELSELLLSVSQLPTASFLLIDGLDECEDSDRREVLSCLTNLIRKSQSRIKIILSSRWMDILESLENFRPISLESSRNCEDIELYIRGTIDQRILDRIIRIRKPSLAEEIKNALIQKSDGM